MLSFVVQNFYSTPFLPKTQRYNKLIVANNTQLLYIFIKENVHCTWNKQINVLTNLPASFLFDTIFTRRFYKFFKPLYTRYLGIMTVNLTKSALHKTFSDLNAMLRLSRPLIPHQSHFYCAHNIKYLQPVTVVTFSFQKTTYNTLMIYILFLLTNFYTPSQNSFKLYYSFIIQPSGLIVYPFLNLFYFKMRQF